MNESSAREVLLLQAFESQVPASPHWGDDDRNWATRVALQDVPGGHADASADLAAADDGFLARRARHALQRLLPREPALARWLARRLWRPSWVGAAMAVGAVLGLLADSIGSSQRINLLAPPVWTVVAWNLLVYGTLLVGTVRAVLRRRTSPPRGRLVRLTERLMRLGWRVPASKAAGSRAAVLRRFGETWLAASAPLTGRRAALLLHAGAAALGAGLIAGLYARGLVLDYRASWESTFLSADSVHHLLAILLAPASWLSGIGLPDAARLAALRAVHGVDIPGAPAAPWIPLYALTVLLAVVAPRSLLAVISAWRARRLAADFLLPLADVYFQRLLRQRSGGPSRVQLLPYATTLSAQAVQGLRQVLTEVLGGSVRCDVAATTAFGDEDAALPHLPADTAHAIALFDLTATPEPEHHGAFLHALAAGVSPGATTLLWVDEAAFVRRFGANGPRLAERRAAWGRMAEAHGSVAVCVDLTAPNLPSAAAALQFALTASRVSRQSN